MSSLGSVDSSILWYAHASGFFPMAKSATSKEILWLNPERRGVIFVNAFHLPRSLAKSMRKMQSAVTLNRDFAAVITGCAEREDTWINEDIRELYISLHHAGRAHSVEIWHADGSLIGGVYGVAVGSVFCAESKFGRARDLSKAALASLVAYLRQAHFTLIDTQFYTDHLARFGAREIARKHYKYLLKNALSAKVNIGECSNLRSTREIVEALRSRPDRV